MSYPVLTTKRPVQPVKNNLKEAFYRGCEVAAFQSNLGWIVAVRHDSLLVRLSFGYSSRAAAMKAIKPFTVDHRSVDDWSDQLAERLAAFADGSPEQFDDISLDLSHRTPFQRKVVACCRKIGFGQTLTYGQLAAKTGHHGAARAVGQVMAQNRFPIVVPCHRVVGSSGGLGGFSAPDGIRMKRRLLRSEGVEI